MDAVTSYQVGDATAIVIAGADDSLERLVMPDVELRFVDGSRWSATVATTADIDAVMANNAGTGEDLGGRFFACSDLLIDRR